MRILYSQLKELIPGLSATPKEAGEVFTMIGYMMEKFDEVQYKDNLDYLYSLEIRENRPDCMSVLGLARELAAYYALEIRVPDILDELPFPDTNLEIEILDKEAVSRVVAVSMDNIKIGESPEWLKEYLSYYDINTINNLVDITNYVMLMTGEPSHAFDQDKVHGHLKWGMNKRFKEVTTLDGSTYNIDGSILLIEDDENPLSLSGIVGGDLARIDEKTKSIIVEMAVYDRVIVRKNSRSLNVTTEASRRHEKEIDPNNLDYSFRLLITLINEYCSGEVTSKIFNYYPNPYIAPVINFDPSIPSLYAGVDISVEQSEEILKNLGCDVKKHGNLLKVTPPLNRMDLQISEDIIEEVVRMYGFYNIPSDQTPPLTVVKNITPFIVKLDEKIKDILSIIGFDEIQSWPLTQLGVNRDVNYKNWSIVTTQNSVNEEYPELRQSLLTGLLTQLDIYDKNNLSKIRIFEVGKIYGKNEDEYIENESLGMLTTGDDINALRKDVESLLRYVGLSEIKYEKAKTTPMISNKYSCFDILIHKKRIGIIYKLSPEKVKSNTYFAEINLTLLTPILENISNNPITELNGKLVMLDSNIELKPDDLIDKYLDDLYKLLPNGNVWIIEIHDAYKLKSTVRYTIRVIYKGLSDVEAKKVNDTAFDKISNSIKNTA